MNAKQLLPVMKADNIPSTISRPYVEGVQTIRRIERTQGWVSLQLRELWHYRELIYFFVWRDIKVKYRQTALGVSWAVIQPFFMMVVFSLFFGKLARIPSDGLPYPIFSYAAMVPWTFFANGLTQTANSLVGTGANLIKKVYFPRLTIPLAAVLSGVVDFFFALVVLFGMMFYFGIVPGVNIVWLPFFLLLALATCLAAGLWLSALNVKYRDIRYVVPFLIQVWLFASPIVYPSSFLSGWQRTLYGLNPMVGVVDGFRWALLGTASFDFNSCILSVVVAVMLLVGGAFYFRRVEKSFADIL